MERENENPTNAQLPNICEIAMLFSVATHEKYGRKNNRMEQESSFVSYENHITGETSQIEANNRFDIPWDDDGKLRAVVFIGHNLVMEQDCTRASEITFEYEGAALDIISSFSVTCDGIDGTVKF